MIEKSNINRRFLELIVRKSKDQIVDEISLSHNKLVYNCKVKSGDHEVIRVESININDAVKDGKVFCLKNGYEIQENYDKVIVIKDLGTILTFIDDASSSDFEPYDHERVFKAFNEIYSIIIRNSSL